MADRPPGEQQVVQLVERGTPLGDHLEPTAVEADLVKALDEQPAGDALEVEAGDPVVAHALGGVRRHRQDLESRLCPEDAQGGLTVGRGDDGLVGVRGDLAGRRPIHLAIHPDDSAERGDRIRVEGMAIGLDELVARGDPDRVRVLDDGDRGRREVLGEPVGRIQIEVVVERRPLAPDLGRVGESPAAMGRLAIERGPLMGVLAIAQVVDLLQDDGEALREGVVRDLVQVGRDLGVVGGQRAECVRGELGAELGADGVMALQLGNEVGVVLRAANRSDPRPVAGRRAEECRSAHVDHLDRLVDRHEVGADSRGERADVDDNDVDRADSLGDQLVHLGGHVAASEDAGVDRGVECLDLATDEGRQAGDLGDGPDCDPVGRKVIAGAVRRDNLDVQREELAGQGRDPVAVGDRQQGSHPGFSSSDADPCRGHGARTTRDRV